MKEMFGKDIGEKGTCGEYVSRVWAKRSENPDYDFTRRRKSLVRYCKII